MSDIWTWPRVSRGSGWVVCLSPRGLGVSVSMAISMGLHALPQQLVGVPTTLTRAPGLYNHTDPWSQEAPWHAVLRVSPSAPQRPRRLWRCLGGHSRGSKQEAECDGSNKAAFLVTLVNRQVLFHLAWRGRSDVKERWPSAPLCSFHLAEENTEAQRSNCSPACRKTFLPNCSRWGVSCGASGQPLGRERATQS